MRRSLETLARSYMLSSYRENLFEQIFCSELLQGCWLAGLPPIEIDRPFVDFQGYDLVATCANVTRHIQLKASRGGQLAVHRNLELKPSACVVNLEPAVAHDPDRLVFTYKFFGSAPGEPIDLHGLPAAKKSINTRQANGEFGKSERSNHVRIPQSRFTKSMGIVALAKALFGENQDQQNP